MSRRGSILNKVIKQDFAQEKSTFQQGPGEGEGEIREAALAGAEIPYIQSRELFRPEYWSG